MREEGGRKNITFYKKAIGVLQDKGKICKSESIIAISSPGSLCSLLPTIVEAPGFPFSLNALVMGDDTPSQHPPRAQPVQHPKHSFPSLSSPLPVLICILLDNELIQKSLGFFFSVVT